MFPNVKSRQDELENSNSPTLSIKLSFDFYHLNKSRHASNFWAVRGEGRELTY